MAMRHIRASRLLAFTLLLPLLASALGPPGGIPAVEAAPATVTDPGSKVFTASTPTPAPTPHQATQAGGLGVVGGGNVYTFPTPTPTPCPSSGISALHGCLGNVVAT